MIENVGYLGGFHIYQLISVYWHSNNKTGDYIARTTLGTMEIYFEDDLVPLDILHIYDISDFDSTTGFNVCEIVIGLGDDYINHRFNLVLKNAVIDSENVSSAIANFDIIPFNPDERYYPAMRKLITPKVLIDE
jgi:hypothetical protein